MSALEDKLLGEQTYGYCSSSESEAEKSEEENESDELPGAKVRSANTGTSDIREWDGSSSNTGPKGVIKDWQRFKQLETEKRVEQEKERVELMKKLSLTCSSVRDDEKAKEEVDPELEELLSDNILQQFVQQRMEEMLARTAALPKFGNVVNISSGQDYLDAVDKEDKNVTIVIHIYEDDAPGCEAMNGCLMCLSQEHPNVKFCKVKASIAGVSRRFKVSGVPALLVYKGGQLVGNFVRLVDEFGEDYFAEEVESFLIQHGILQDKSCIPQLIRKSQPQEDEESDLSLE